MTLETMQAVVEELRGRKVAAALEYPGFIRVGRMCIADVDDTINADVYETDDLNFIGQNQPIETIESTIPRDCADVIVIADFIHGSWFPGEPPKLNGEDS